jgi:hypothetical protein
LEVFFSPFTISTTCSMGMRISPKRSWRASWRTRSSSDFFTLFSKPEYVCTAYHFLDIASPVGVGPATRVGASTPAR